MSVVVIIVTHNGKAHLDTCISSLQNQTYKNFRTLLVDNASSDGSGEYVKNKYPFVTVIFSDKNLGCPGGWNLAVQHTKEDYLVFLNDDTEATPNWLEELLKHAESENVSIVTGKMLMFNDRNRINAAGAMTDLLGLSWNRGINEIDNGQYDYIEETFRAVGGNMLIKREVFETIGLFDPDFFMYVEEEDFCWRARLAGYRILYIPTATLYHKWRGSFKEEYTGRSHIFYYFIERNRLQAVLKNYSVRTLISLLPVYLFLKILTLFWFAFHSYNYLGLVKAFFWNLKKLPTIWKKRVSIQSIRKVSDKEIQKFMVRWYGEVLFALKKIKHPIVEIK